MVRDLFGTVAGWAARNALVVIAVASVVTLVAGIAITQIRVDSGVDTLVEREGQAYSATEQVRQSFGEDPVVILAQGDLRQLLSPPNILRLLNLEACLAGNVPEEAKPLPGPCRELAELRPAKLVSGPATFLNQAASGISDEISRRMGSMQRQAQAAARKAQRRVLNEGGDEAAAAEAAREASSRVSRRFLKQALGFASRYGLTGIPGLTDPGFIQAVVFDREAEPGTPKPRLAYLFPSSQAAQIVVRLRPDLTEAERRRALALIREAASETRPRERCTTAGSDPEPCFALEGGRYAVSGAPVVLEAVADELKGSLTVLLVVALILMAIVLPIVLRSRAPLLPGAVALGAAATTFGAYGLAGGRLTIAAIAVLPILIGLAVDYAVQMQSRFDEALAAGQEAEAAAVAAAREGAPALALACLATAAGFAMLVFSPTPMVRGFGLILTLGVLIAFGYALLVGSAALCIRELATARLSAKRARRAAQLRVAHGESGRPGAEAEETLWSAARSLPSALAAVVGASHDRLASRAGSAAQATLRTVTASPGRALAIAVMLALLGWAVGTRTETASELPELMPPNLAEVRDLQTLQEATGVSGELDVGVTAPDLTDPELISWMAGFKRRVLEKGGYSLEDPSCIEAEICPGPSLTDFIADAEKGVSRDRIQNLLAALPLHELQGMAEVDPADATLGRRANIPLMIRLMPLERQQELIEMIRDQVDQGEGPPDGVEVAVGGLPVVAAETATDLAASRYWLTLAALVAVLAVLAVALRSVVGLTVVMAPILLATGWSSLMLALLGIPLNPVSAVLGVMVVAIGTEFSVILSSRYRQERGRGFAPKDALARTYGTTGAAVFASGATVIAGFAALIASDIRMLRDFGIVTVVDLTVALAGVMLILPCLLILFERRGRSEREGRGGPPSESRDDSARRDGAAPDQGQTVEVPG